MTATSGIVFLNSTTSTTVTREADGGTGTQVTHVARFAIKPGAIPDTKAKYSTAVFRPSRLKISWFDGRLQETIMSGPCVLRRGLPEYREGDFNWWDRDELPDAIAARIAEYEAEVAVTHPGNSTLDDAYASLLSARNIIAELWNEAEDDSDLEARLEFANIELVNILDDLRGFVSADHDWPPARLVGIVGASQEGFR